MIEHDCRAEKMNAKTQVKQCDCLVGKGTRTGWEPEIIYCKLHAAAPETAAERDWLKEINAELLDACKFALDVATIQAKNPKTTSGTIQTLKDHLEAAISKAEGGE